MEISRVEPLFRALTITTHRHMGLSVVDSGRGDVAKIIAAMKEVIADVTKKI